MNEQKQMNTWEELIQIESEKTYYTELERFMTEERRQYTVFPPENQVLDALRITPLTEVKAVIMGQDPYHEPGQATGLAFSVPDGVRVPPSLANIFREISREYGTGIPESGNLERWASQGVLLLNAVLTVRIHEANSHAGHGWEQFTDSIIQAVAMQDRPVVFMLWGNPAQKKTERILKKQNLNHLILKTSHPSPLSVYRGFEGCGHFRLCNDFLIKHGLESIRW